MSINYAKPLPHGSDGQEQQECPPPFLAKQARNFENGTVSSVISFTHDTTSIEVAAVGGAAVIKWIATSDTQASVVSAISGANYDHVISKDTVRRFILPIESQGTTPGSVVGVNRGNGLYQRIAYKSMGVSSVLLAEY